MNTKVPKKLIQASLQEDRAKVRFEAYSDVADAFLRLEEDSKGLPTVRCRGCGGEGLGGASVLHTSGKCVFVELMTKWGVPVQVLD